MIVLLTFCLYILLLVLVKLDIQYVYRWPLFFLYSVIVLIIPVFLIVKQWQTIKIRTSYFSKYCFSSEGKKDTGLFVIIAILAVTTRFLFLKNHPFLTWGDELWETGLDTLTLLSGEVKNFYLLGFPDPYRTPSMGLIITLIPALFAPFFAHTPYMYRIPAALFGTAEILLVYLICRTYINRGVAFCAALTMIALPIHIYFSRTELVVISDAFMTTSTIFLLFLTYKRFIANTGWIALIGLWFGFTATFHPSVKIIAFISLGITFIIFIKQTFTNQYTSSRLISLGKFVVFLIVFFCVGFGPKILFSTSKNFANSQTSVLFQNINLQEYPKFTPHVAAQLKKNIVNVLIERYPTSFLGYIKKPLTNLVEFHYTEEKPLLPPLLTFLFLTGLLSLLWIPSPLAKWFGGFALLVPLTHSALTPELNWSYRMFVASSSVAVIIGTGMWQIISKISLTLVKFAFITAFCLYLFYITMRFFIVEPHMANRPVEEYMTTHLSYFLQSHLNPNQEYQFCMRVNPKQLKFLNWVHAHNQYKYFMPNVTISVSPDPRVAINTLYLEENCQPETTFSKYVINCSQNLYSICPQPTQFRQQNEPNEINKDFIFYY